MNTGELLHDSDFQRLLRRRSRLRWGLAGFLTATYLAYGLGGLYAPDFFAAKIAGSAVSLSILLGYGIILLGITCSIYYVWQVNRIVAPLQKRLAGERG
jgi:uncharacterized membrane protein (DUF485 family)